MRRTKIAAAMFGATLAVGGIAVATAAPNDTPKGPTSSASGDEVELTTTTTGPTGLEHGTENETENEGHDTTTTTGPRVNAGEHGAEVEEEHEAPEAEEHENDHHDGGTTTTTTGQSGESHSGGHSGRD